MHGLIRSLFFLVLVIAAETHAEVKDRDALKAAMLAARDDTTMTIYFKSGLTSQIRFDKKLGTLGQLSSDFAAYAGGSQRRVYSYHSVRDTDGSLAVDFESVEGISEVFH